MVRIVDADDWEHGEAKGVCNQWSLYDLQPVVEVKAWANHADLAVTLIHEYAHALLHFDIEGDTERAKCEVEAEAVAYIVGQYFDLDTSDSAFYLAAWQDDDADVIHNRLGRIRTTPARIIEVVGTSCGVGVVEFERRIWLYHRAHSRYSS